MTMFYVLGALIISYIIIMLAVKSGKTDAFDIYLMRKIHLNADGSVKPQQPKILRLMIDTTALGGDTLLVILSLLMIGIAALTDNSLLLQSYVVVALPSRMLGYVMKKAVNRSRPDLRPNAPQMFTSSFPSVHTMMATCLYLWLGFIMPQIIGMPPSIILCTISITLITTIAYSRLYLCVHWPSDILGGAIAGLIVIVTNILIFG